MRKTSILIFVFLFSILVRGQETNTFHLTFNHLALSVKDVNSSAEFYKNVLKLTEIENRAKLSGVRWFSMGDGKELHLGENIKEPIALNKAIHIAFTTSNFDAVIKTLNERKIVYSDWPGNLNKIHLRADGIKQIYFQDPDGYWIEVNSLEQNVK